MFLSSFCCAAKVQAGADVSSVPGRGSGSVHMKADGKDRMRLDAQMSHSVQGGDRAAALTVNVSQSLLGSAAHLHVELAANVSAEKSEPPLHFGLCLTLSTCCRCVCMNSWILLFLLPPPVCLYMASINRDMRFCSLRSKGPFEAAGVSSWLCLET